jgi:hypothetical protein
MVIHSTVLASANFGNEAAGGLYGAGRFGYSINQFSASDATVSFRIRISYN